MQAHVIEPSRTIVPTLRYRNVADAIDWLCGAFGFERHLVVPGDDGRVRYAELTFGDGMIMLGPVEDTAFGNLMRQPDDGGGTETQICYLFVPDVAAHCAQARSAGADIVLDIEGEGSRQGYACRDLEGHIWNFGSYAPRRPQAEGAETPKNAGYFSSVPKVRRRRATLVWGLLLTVVASAAALELANGANGWTPQLLERLTAPGEPGDAAEATAREQLQRAREERMAAERAIKEAREQLTRERSAREAAERTAEAIRMELAAQTTARAAAERTSNETRELLARDRTAKDTEERAKQEAQERLAAVRAEEERLEQQRTKEEQIRQERLKEELAREERLKQEQRLLQEERAKEARLKQERAREEREERERQQRAKRQAPRRVYVDPGPSIGPFTIWPK